MSTKLTIIILTELFWLLVMSWYNKYRPSSFDEVIGQNLVKNILQNAIAKNKIKHGYLLSGSKGVGKTTLARIFASQINDLSNNPEAKIDIFELDAASNTGVDDVRNLIDEAKAPPLVGKFKIFIIDEVHMLSKPAMNAMLKILEEPPSYIVFLLATTNPEKLIPTVLSRLTKLNLTNHSKQDLVANLKRICLLENLKIDDPSLDLIASRSGGSQRDSINLLETIAGYELDSYNLNQVLALLGLTSFEILEQVSIAVLNKDPARAIASLKDVNIDGQTFLNQWLDYLIDLSISGQNQFDVLIPFIAETISLKLSLSSSYSALALIQVKMQGYVSQEVSKKKLDDLSQQTKNPDKELLLYNLGSNNLKDKVENSLDKIKEPAQVEDSLDFNINQVKLFINQCAGKKDAPIALKMLSPNIFFELKEDIIQVKTTNQVFLSQLKNPTILSFITDQIHNKFGRRVLVDDKLLDNSVNQVQPDNLDNLDLENQQNSKIVDQDTTDKVIQTKETDAQDNNEGNQVFYEIYNQYPSNWNGDKIKIFRGSLEITQNSKSWDEHTSDLFEFE